MAQSTLKNIAILSGVGILGILLLSWLAAPAVTGLSQGILSKEFLGMIIIAGSVFVLIKQAAKNNGINVTEFLMAGLILFGVFVFFKGSPFMILSVVGVQTPSISLDLSNNVTLAVTLIIIFVLYLAVETKHDKIW